MRAARFAPILAAVLALVGACSESISEPSPSAHGAAPADGVAPAPETSAGLTPAQPREAEPIDPSSLVGLDADAIRQKLGRPGFVRKESGARVWQYFALDCILDLFLYQDGAGEPFRAAYAQLRSRVAGEPGRCPREGGFPAPGG